MRCRRRSSRSMLARALDEHLLGQTICVALVRVVLPLARFSDLGQMPETHGATAFPKYPEVRLRLARQRDVAEQARIVALARGIGKTADCVCSDADRPREDSRVRRPKFAQIVLQHALLVAHRRHVPGTKIPVPGVFRLGFVIFQRLEKSQVLGGRSAYLSP